MVEKLLREHASHLENMDRKPELVSLLIQAADEIAYYKRLTNGNNRVDSTGKSLEHTDLDSCRMLAGIRAVSDTDKVDFQV